MRSDFAWPLGFCAVLLAPPADAQIVKCTDAEGSVTYSDLPCLRSEKTAVVDTRASSNVMDHSSIRAQTGRLATPVAAPPVSYAPPAPSKPPPAESTPRSQIQPGRSYSR